MKAFSIVYGPRAAPRLSLTVMAADSFTAQEQHECLRDGNERMDVTPLYHQRNDKRAEALDQRQADVERVIAGRV